MRITHNSVCKTALPLIVASTLAACGGSSTSSGSSPSASFSEIADEARDFFEELETTPFTSPTTLPSSGSATYDGVIGANLDNGSAVAGDLELIANFGSDSISGSASNFFDDQENSLGGSLAISDSFLDRTANTDIDYTFGASLAGTLTSDDGDAVVDAIILGDFLGSSHRNVGGIVFGSVTQNNDTLFLDGDFVAER